MSPTSVRLCLILWNPDREGLLTKPVGVNPLPGLGSDVGTKDNDPVVSFEIHGHLPTSEEVEIPTGVVDTLTVPVRVDNSARNAASANAALRGLVLADEASAFLPPAGVDQPGTRLVAPGLSLESG